MLAILDYKAGNQTSVRRALEYLNIPCRIAATAEETKGARGLIFPGVGAARQAMDHLRATNMDRVLAEGVAAGLPILGICLGCQILLEYSEENGNTPTLGHIPGYNRAFDPAWTDGGEPIRIPHMGWNSLRRLRSSALLDGVPDDASAYFVHSYAAPVSADTVAASDHGGLFSAVVQRGRHCGAQFHPERSAATGARILGNFLEMDF